MRVSDANGSAQIAMVTETYVSQAWAAGAYTCRTSGFAYIPAGAYLNVDTTSSISSDTTGVFRLGLRLVSIG